MSKEPTLSIGAVSKATGVPIETLRTWERRYGFPSPDRRPSGHRVYALSTVPRIRRVVQALQQGHRPADMLKLKEHELAELIERTVIAATTAPRGTHARTIDIKPTDLLAATLELDEVALRSALQLAGLRRTPLAFMTEIVVPMLQLIGDGWEQGAVAVRHEHFASAILADVLLEMRRRFERRKGGPLVAMATLPGDHHELGLLMAAVLFAERGWRVIYLGRDTPLQQITALAGETPLEAVVLSISPSAAPDATAALQILRKRMPATTRLIVGGAGVPDSLERVEAFEDLPALDAGLRADRTAKPRAESAARRGTAAERGRRALATRTKRRHGRGPS